jgi:hypothetical protein
MWFCNRGYEPPTKNDVLSNKSYRWNKDATEHFDFYFESSFIPKEYVDSAKTIFEENILIY